MGPQSSSERIDLPTEALPISAVFRLRYIALPVQKGPHRGKKPLERAVSAATGATVFGANGG